VRVLIVDDDDDMRKVIRATLEPLTHDLHEARNAIDALKVARAERPDFVILDIMMPGVDGYEICYLIKTAPELKHTRVIILTVRRNEIDISIGRGALADAYLLKPLTPGRLLGAIEKLEGGERGRFLQ